MFVLNLLMQRGYLDATATFNHSLPGGKSDDERDSVTCFPQSALITMLREPLYRVSVAIEKTGGKPPVLLGKLNKGNSFVNLKTGKPATELGFGLHLF